MAFLDFLPIIGDVAKGIFNSTVGQSQSKELMRYQQQLNQESIDAQNRYNSPIAQMERLQEAGLNPNLVYGSGVDGNQSGAAQVSQSNRHPQLDTSFNEVVANIFRRKQIENETRLTAASEEEKRANALLQNARYLDVMEDLSRKYELHDDLVEQARQNLKNSQAAYDETLSRTSLNKQKELNLKEEVNQIRAITRNYDAKTVTEKCRPAEVRAHTKLLKEQSSTSAKQRELYDSIMALNDKKIDYLFALTEKTWHESDIKKYEAEVAERMNQVGLNGFKPKDFLQMVVDILKMAFK